MRHVVASKVWKFSTEPFPAYRARLEFGRNKFAHAFLPVKGTTPTEAGTLPEGAFRVIRTREKGTVLVVPGEDTTRRCLLMTACAGGFRGSVSLLEEATTGRVLTQAFSANACESGLAVAALLEPGQSVVFHSYGRRTNDVLAQTWDGDRLAEQRFRKEEWDALRVPEDGEVL